MKVFPQSSFFKVRETPHLPPPSTVRAINEQSGNVRATYFNRPPPVKIPELGLVIKYGADVTITEAQTQIMVREELDGQVPVPEVFGWTEDGGQVFIYMSIVEGDSLEERWGSMDESERRSICAELKDMSKAWRALEQQGHEPYIGSFKEQPLNDIFLESCPRFAGPFLGVNAVQDFHRACDIEISDETAIVFTHDDLAPPNILVSSGPNPKVEAVLDWAQAGWYPAYWEHCKARRVKLDPKVFSDAMQEEWWSRYLPMILDPVDDESCYYPWLRFVLSKGI